MRVGWLQKPAPRIPVAVRVALTTSWTVSPWATKRSGNSCTCSWRTSPPNKLHLATPGTASKRGRRSPLRERPQFHGREVGGQQSDLQEIHGRRSQWRHPGAQCQRKRSHQSSASRSEINCRARIRSVPSVNTTVGNGESLVDSERRGFCGGARPVPIPPDGSRWLALFGA